MLTLGLTFGKVHFTDFDQDTMRLHSQNHTACFTSLMPALHRLLTLSLYVVISKQNSFCIY